MPGSRPDVYPRRRSSCRRMVRAKGLLLGLCSIRADLPIPATAHRRLGFPPVGDRHRHRGGLDRDHGGYRSDCRHGENGFMCRARAWVRPIAEDRRDHRRSVQATGSSAGIAARPYSRMVRAGSAGWVRARCARISPAASGGIRAPLSQRMRAIVSVHPSPVCRAFRRVTGATAGLRRHLALRASRGLRSAFCLALSLCVDQRLDPFSRGAAPGCPQPAGSRRCAPDRQKTRMCSRVSRRTSSVNFQSAGAREPLNSGTS